jgi:acyl-CoA synthetase (NDP forming)
MAIMGVSAKGMNPGRIILRNTLAEGFPPHRIWVVKPGQAELDGCTCVDSLEDLPERVDTLVLAIPASDVPEAVAEAVFGERARSIVLIPGGLGEAEGTGDRVDSIRRTLAEARARGLPDVPLNGGNCLGIRSARARTNSLFIPRYKLSFPDKTPDPLAFISQSGAFAVARLSAWPELNPQLVATVGNQVDVTVGDYLEAVLERPEIRVTALYVEGFRPADGRRVLRAARALRDQGRAVVIYRAGRTAAGKEASASHTASLAGDAVVTASACRAAGALVADTLEEFDGLVSVSLALGERPLRGRRLAALSNAGFECVALMDHAAGLDMAEFNPETVGRIQGQLDRAGVGEIVRAANPLDLTPMMGDEGFEALVRAVLEDEAVDLALVGCVPLTGALDTLPAGAGHEESLLDPGSLAQRLVRLWRETTIPWAAVVDGGPRFDPMVTILQKAGMPVFRSGDQAARILSSYASWRMGTGSQREA